MDTEFRKSPAYAEYIINHFEFRAKGSDRTPCEFRDIDIGSFFVFQHDLRGRFRQQYTPILRKTGEFSYEFNIGCSVFNDRRNYYSVPKIRGNSYANTVVLAARQENDGNWVLTQYLEQ